MGNDFNELIRKMTIPVIIALMGGLARFAFSGNRSFGAFIRGVIIAGFVGVMVTFALEGTLLAEGTKGMIIGVASFCADETIMFVLACAKEIKKDPLKYLMNVIDAFRGGSGGVKKDD